MAALKLWWTSKAWPWLQKNWQWVLLPIGILMFFAKLKPSTTVVAADTVGAAETEQKANTAAAQKADAAKVVEQKTIQEALDTHDEVIVELTDKQRKNVDALREDPQKLNDYLKDVGKKVKG